MPLTRLSPVPPFPVWHINFTAISRQQLQVIQTSFVALRLVSFSLSTSPLYFPARLHFVSFSFRESASASSSASCAELKQAEILLPLFMLSLCNILPPAAAVSSAVGAAAAALGALVFNILQLVKALRSTSLCLQLPLCLCPCSCSCCNGNRSRAVIQITRQMVFLSFASLLQVPFHCFGYWYLKLCINKSISLLSS